MSLPPSPSVRALVEFPAAPLLVSDDGAPSRYDTAAGGTDNVSETIESPDRRRRYASTGVKARIPAHRAVRSKKEYQPRRRAVTNATHHRKGKGRISELDTSQYDFGIGQRHAYEDGDSVSGESKVADDVSRVLRLKARRELQTTETLPSAGTTLSGPSTSSSSTLPQSLNALGHVSTPNLYHAAITKAATDSLDFSPAVASRSDLHPVPRSSDSGTTLDWSNAVDKEQSDKTSDVSWAHRTFSFSRRKSREKAYSMSSAAAERDSHYAGKLAQILKMASEPTKRKADITRRQIESRYNFISTHGAFRDGNSHNLLCIARWSTQEEPLMNSCLDVEPMSWLKHLIKGGPDDRSRPRFPWHVTALIISEYSKLYPGHAPLASPPPPSRLLSPLSNTAFSGSMMSVSERGKSTDTSPSVFTTDNISFGPTVEAKSRNSGPVQQLSRRTVRHSLPVFQNPMQSRRSASSMHSEPHTDGSSSVASIRHKSPGLSITMTPVTAPDEMPQSSQKRSERIASVKSVDFAEVRDPHTDEDVNPKDKRASVDTGGQSPFTLPESSVGAVVVEEPQPMSDHVSQPPRQGDSLTLPRRYALRGRSRTTLPSETRAALQELSRATRDRLLEQEQAERSEYDHRQSLLDAAIERNSELRSLLTRVTVTVRNANAAQVGHAQRLGLSVEPLPQNVLETLPHDPSSVTGRTRTFKSYQAVEDIHTRIIHQRSALESYLQDLPDTPMGMMVPSEGLLANRLSEFVSNIQLLEREKPDLDIESTQLLDLLTRVKDLHSRTKNEYNLAATRLAVSYPELPSIVALEQRIRDSSSTWWEFVLRIFTFMLDLLAVFLKAYGTRIWKDLESFLVIPFYRTGYVPTAPKIIEEFPKRSFLHWVGWLCFFSACGAAFMLPGRFLLTLFWFGINSGFHPFFVSWWLIIGANTIATSIIFLVCILSLAAFLAQIVVMGWWILWALGVTK